MKCLKRNQTDFYYSLFDKKEPVTDEKGRRTGSRLVYKSPVKMSANISSAQGENQAMQFGISEKYDKVIVTEDINCPINENTVLFVDKSPEFDGDGNPIYDYIVKKVAKSLNSISYAIEKVKVS